MGQTSSSTSASSTPAISSSVDASHHLPSEYGVYAQHQQNAAYQQAQVEGDSPAPPPPSDGYRWRKYGQKSVKGSAYARNYYKCTYPGCTVKKQVDKINSNGKVIDQVLCKGEHCHGPPQITRINAHDQQTFRNSVINESLAHTEIMVKQEDTPGARTTYAGSSLSSSGSLPNNMNGLHNSGGIPRARASPNVNTGQPEAYNYIAYDQHSANPNAAYGPNDMVIYNKGTSDSLILVPTNNNIVALNSENNDGSDNDNELNTKSTLGNSANLAQPTINGSAISSPRLVIETNTNVDCLDDGYHWRKYGQKTVKGSPFPRSYYKCTEKGCSVKKQVEQNGTSIVNTYEGTHTHIAPAMDDNSDMVKKRRNRRSESHEFNTPYKRIHTSMDDLSDSKSGTSSPADIATNPHLHSPMPIGSMGSILHHTSHLQPSMNYLGSPQLHNVYTTTSPEHVSYSGYSGMNNNHPNGGGPNKIRVDSSPALAPLHSFSHSMDHQSNNPSLGNNKPHLSL